MFTDVVAGGPNARIDVADFVGPVEIRSSHSGSRSLYATRDVAVGELLFVNKAISVASKKEPEIENVTLMAFNLASNRLRDVTQVLNTDKVNSFMYRQSCILLYYLSPLRWKPSPDAVTAAIRNGRTPRNKYLIN
jgi:hypothetical protein